MRSWIGWFLWLAASPLLAAPQDAAVSLEPAAPPTTGCGSASSTSFTGARFDAPFFVFDGGSQGPGIGQFDRPLGIAFLGAGRLGIVDSGNDRVKIVSTSGFFQDFFGGTGSEAGRLRDPQGLTAAGGGSVWVVDRGNRRLQRLTLFRKVTELPGSTESQLSPPEGAASSWRPAHTATDSQGRLYVVDSARRRVDRHDPGTPSFTAWSPAGLDLIEPYGIAIAADDSVYVSDAGASRIVKLTNGQLDLMWGESGNGDGQPAQPRGLAIDPDGFVYVADSGNHRIQKFDPNGRFIASVGCLGSGVGEFREPSDVALDAERHLYVVDTGNHRVQKLGHQ